MLPLFQTSSELAEEPDLTAWLAEQWWAPVGLCVICCAVGLWMIRSMVLHRGRAAQIRRHATAASMKYSDQDPHGLSRIRFRHFANGEGQGWSASNVITAQGRDGLRAHGFDAVSWSEYDVEVSAGGERSYQRRRVGSERTGFSHTVRRHQGATRSAAVTELPINAPRLMITRENIASKLFAAATRLDIDTESEMFNRSYHVISEDREFAQAFLDARVVDLMARTEGRVSLELVGSSALLVTVLAEPELMPGLVKLAEELRSSIPQLVLDRWPRPGTAREGLRATPR